MAIQSNGSVYYYEWSSGLINTEGKRYFPFGGATEMYGQVKAQMAGPNDGSWSAIWMLPDQGASGTGQEIDIQEYNVSGPRPEQDVLARRGARSAIRYRRGEHSALRRLPRLWVAPELGDANDHRLPRRRRGRHVHRSSSRREVLLDPECQRLVRTRVVAEVQEGFVPNSTADMAMRVDEIQIYQR